MVRTMIVVSLLAIAVSCAFDCIPNPRPKTPLVKTVTKDAVKDKDGLLNELWKAKQSVKLSDGWDFVVLTAQSSPATVGTSIMRVSLDYDPSYASDPGYSDDMNYNELTSEDHCIFDGSFYYFKKTFFDMRVICPELSQPPQADANAKTTFPVADITNKISDTDWAKVVVNFEALPEKIKERAGTEIVKGLKNSGVAQWGVSRRIVAKMRPYYTYYRSQVETNEVNKVYKCVKFGDHYYTIRYFNPDSISKAENIAAHKAKKPSERVQTYINMAKALKVVHDKKVIQGLLGPDNFKYNGASGMLIEHALDMLPSGTTNNAPGDSINFPFYAKEGGFTSSPFEDIYLTALTIVGMEAGNFDTLWKQDPTTNPKVAIPDNYFPVDNLADPNQYLNKIVKGVLTPAYGDADHAAQAPVDGSLTSLILFIINRGTQAYTDAQFIASLEKVQTALKAKNQRNLEQEVI